MRVAAAVALAVGVSCHGQADVSQPAPQPKPVPAAVPTPPEPVKPPEPPPPPPPTTVTHAAPGGIEETCQLLVEFPFKPADVVTDPKEPRWYRKDDFEEIAELCKMSLYAPQTTDTVTAVGVCPKTHWSTPALEVHAIDQLGMKKVDFEKTRCKRDRRMRGAKKVAKFKVSVYDKEPESGRMYFHYSRLLALDAFIVPVTYRTISRREIKRWASTAISTLTSRSLARMNPLDGWSVLKWRHRKGEDVIAGSFAENPRGEDDYRAFSYIGGSGTRIAVIWQFRGRPYYKLAASRKPIADQIKFAVEQPRKFDQQLQALATAQDFVHMLILDHLFNQRDRGGNINSRVRYHYLDDKQHLRWKKSPGKDDDKDAVPLERLLLKDNDDGLRWDKFGLLNATLIIDDIRHLDTLAYARIQWLAKLMTDLATKDAVRSYFEDIVHVSPKSYEDVRVRLIDLAATLARKYADGRLMLDLDIEPVLATRPPSSEAVVRKPGKP